MSVKKVLIADDDSDLARMLKLRCERLGLDVFCSPDAMHALVGAHRMEPDLIVLDVNMPSGNGLSVCEMLANDSRFSTVPVIIMTGLANDTTRQRCKALGAHYVRKGAGLWERLEALICELLHLAPPPPLREAPVDVSQSDKSDAPDVEPPPDLSHSDEETPLPQRPKVLSIDDDPDISKAIKLRLAPFGIEVFRAFSGMNGFWSCLDFKPHVVITDMNMPDGEGNYIFHRLRSHPLTEKLPVIVLTGQDNPALKRQMLSVGVDAYLTKPLVFEDLLAELERHIDLPAKT